MEKPKKKKIYNGKMKISKNKIIEKEPNSQKTIFSELSYHNFGYFPLNIFEVKEFKERKDSKNMQEDNYHQTIFELKEKMDQARNQVNDLVSKKIKILEFLKEIQNNINLKKNGIVSKINKIKDEEIIIEDLREEKKKLESDFEKSEMKKKVQKKLYESAVQSKSNEIILLLQEIDKEKNNLLNMESKKDEAKKDIITEEQAISLKYQSIHNEQEQKMELIKKKNELKEQYDKVNKIAIKDNRFCHDNFYSLLIFFPYYKNVAFISSDNNENNKENKEKNDLIEIDINKETDINKIITEEEINEDIEKENIKNIKLLIKQRENCDKNINFKILKDRRTLQINPKEKYKFKKIFSTINNNYIAEPWNEIKFTSLKFYTINSYFNEFNMTTINNNYFIIYFIPKIEKVSIDNEIFKIFVKLKNSEYIDKNIITKISAITESNYINLKNINQEAAIKSQLLSVQNEGFHTIYGFLFEFIKTNRLNKKNIFRIYYFDYYYPYAVEMMNNIYKYYAKKKRKKTGVYKKVIRQGQGKPKKKQQDRSTNNNNNNLNKGNIKTTANNNQSNMNKVKNKKTINTNFRNTKRNNSFIELRQQNKSNNMNKNKNNGSRKLNIIKKDNKNNFISNDKKLVSGQKQEEKNNLKQSDSQNQLFKKDTDKINLNKSNNNIKVIKFDTKTKSITPKKNNNCTNGQKAISLVFNDLKLIKPEHTLIIHDINDNFVETNEFKKVAKACGMLNNIEK